jgi:hypothetical protein
MSASDSGSGEMFHALIIIEMIIIEMIGISGVGKRALGNN